MAPYSLSPSFYRAEAAWLDPPEYTPTPDELMQKQQEICKDIEDRVEAFIEEFGGEISPETNFYTLMADLSVLQVHIRKQVYELEELDDEIQQA